MTEWYCHFDLSEFAKAREVQETLLRSTDTTANSSTVNTSKHPGSVTNKILKMPNAKDTQVKKGA